MTRLAKVPFANTFSCRGISISTDSTLFLLLPSIIGQEPAARMTSQTRGGTDLLGCRQASVLIAREWPGMRTLTSIYGERMVLYRVNIER